MELKLETRADHLLALVFGPYDQAAARSGLAQIVSQCQALGLTRILIDGRGISSPVSIADRYELATTLATLGGDKLRTAILVAPDNMYTKTLENTAVNMGAQVRTTDSLEEALRYLEVAP